MQVNDPSDDVTWSATPNPPRAPPVSPVPRVLLLSMFAIAARFTTRNVEPVPEKGRMWEAGRSYYTDAQEILSTPYQLCQMHAIVNGHTDKILHESRASTCQALLLLGHREFGLGAIH